MSHEDLHAGDDDATDLTPDETTGLIPTWVVTRADLNRAEQANIAFAVRWVRRSRLDVLETEGLLRLHGRMFGDVWRWAGTPRRSEKNIGVADWWRVREHLNMLMGDIATQIAIGTRPIDEIAVTFHHRLVAIHIFPNGNGRHARLAADLLIQRLGGRAFTWGRISLIDASQTRRAYITALKAADAHDLQPLIAFARS